VISGSILPAKRPGPARKRQQLQPIVLIGICAILDELFERIIDPTWNSASSSGR